MAQCTNYKLLSQKTESPPNQQEFLQQEPQALKKVISR